jgi:hypothetical protein
MDPQVSASFIPKKPLTSEPRPRGSAYGFILLIIILIFIASLVAAGAAFAYKEILTAAIASKQHSLQLAQAAYDPGAIQDLARLDDRINQSKTILSKHIAASALFSFLATQTLNNVQFTSLDFELADSGVATIKLNGKADSFSTIALQSDQFGASKVLKEVVFSGIVVDSTTGNVTFTVTAAVDPSLFLYSNSIGTNAAAGSTDTTGDSSSPLGTSTTQ